MQASQIIQSDDKQIIILDWINEGDKTKNFWEKFGQQLATLHKVSAEKLGLEIDNYMAVLFNNNQTKNWNEFFVHQRLQPLVQQCLSKNLLTIKQKRQFEKIYQIVPNIFGENHKPSLLHGDLWSGNFICNEKQEPVLIDPAVYYGHRSIDLAMTNLFGGFPTHFYEAYQYHYSLPANYIEQWKVCNLYQLLIHLLLFGKSYLPQIEDTLSYFSL